MRKEYFIGNIKWARHLQSQNTTAIPSDSIISDNQEGIARIVFFSLLGVAIIIIILTTIYIVRSCKKRAERKNKPQEVIASKMDTTQQALKSANATHILKYCSDSTIPSRAEKLRRQSTATSQEANQRAEKLKEVLQGRLEIICTNQRNSFCKEEGNCDFNKNIVLDIDMLKIEQSFDGCGNKTHDNSTSIQDQSHALQDNYTSTDYKSLNLAERENSFNHCGISYEVRRAPQSCSSNELNSQIKTEVLYFKRQNERQIQTIDEEQLCNNQKGNIINNAKMFNEINQNRAQSSQANRQSQKNKQLLNNCHTELKIISVPKISLPNPPILISSTKMREQVFDYTTFSNLTEEQKAYNQNKMQMLLLKNNRNIKTPRSNQTSKTRISKPPTIPLSKIQKQNKENIMPLHTQKCLQYKNGLQFIKESISLVIN